MANKKCVVNTNKKGEVTSINVKNHTALNPIDLAIKRNSGYPLSQTPEGKPSILYNQYIDIGLSPEQAQTEVAKVYSNEFFQEFGNWIEDPENSSKAVDENGQPKLLWSGQPEKPSEYKGYENVFELDGQQRFDNSAFFVDQKKIAMSYSNGGAMDFTRLGEADTLKYLKFVKSVEPVFLNIRNLRRIEGENSYKIIPQIPESIEKGVDGFQGNTIHRKDGSQTYSIRNGSQVIPAQISGSSQENIIEEVKPSVGKTQDYENYSELITAQRIIDSVEDFSVEPTAEQSYYINPAPSMVSRETTEQADIDAVKNGTKPLFVSDYTTDEFNPELNQEGLVSEEITWQDGRKSIAFGLKENLDYFKQAQLEKNPNVYDLKNGIALGYRPDQIYAHEYSARDMDIEDFIQEYNANKISKEPTNDLIELERRARLNGNWMKAPNQQKTNLSEKQWLQTRTENFKSWFGDFENDPKNASKVVDSNGDPLIVYHGTDENFNQFDNDVLLDNGEFQAIHFFAENQKYAQKFAGIQVKDSDKLEGYILPMFLNIRNPNDFLDGMNPDGTDSINTLTVAGAIELGIKEDGHDGLKGIDSGTQEKVWVTLDGNQQKSAEDNSGEFSQDQNNIYQNKSESVDITPPEVVKEVTDQLMKKGLVSRVFNISEVEMQKKLESLGLSPEISRSISVWHGSPHKFDRFSTDYINSGEGAQHFGWGLYFTEKEAIARSYANIRGSNGLTINGKYTQLSIDEVNIIQKYLKEPMYTEGFRIFLNSPHSHEIYLEKNNKGVWYYKDDYNSSEEDEENDYYERDISRVARLDDFLENGIRNKESDELLKDMIGSDIYDILTDKYNTPIIDNTTGGRNLYKTNLYGDKLIGEYQWLDWYEKVPQNILDNLINILQSEVTLSKIQKYKLGIEVDPNIKENKRRAMKSEILTDERSALIEERENNPIKTKGEYSKRIAEINEELNLINPNYSENVLEVTKPATKGFDIYEIIYESLFDVKNYGELTQEQMLMEKQKVGSLFLLKNGINGIKYPTNTLANSGNIGKSEGSNYVVFDDTAISIEELIDFNKTGLKTIPGGFFNSNTREIFLNSEAPGVLATTIHEFSHPMLQWMRNERPEHFQAGIKVLQNNSQDAQKYIQEVTELYPELEVGSDKFYEEVLANIIGNNGADLVNSARKGSIKEWLDNFWAIIQDIAGITSLTPQQVSEMTLKQFADSVNAEMLNGELLVKQKEMIPSILFEQLSQQPFITKEQAVEAYKTIYTDEVGDWQNSDLEC